LKFSSFYLIRDKAGYGPENIFPIRVLKIAIEAAAFPTAVSIATLGLNAAS